MHSANGSSCLAVVETSAGAALMAADGWHGSAGFRSGAVLLAVGCLPQFFCVARAGAGTLTWAPAFTCWVPGLVWLKQLGSGQMSLSRRAWTASWGGSLKWSDFLRGGQHLQSKGKSSQIS